MNLHGSYPTSTSRQEVGDAADASGAETAGISLAGDSGGGAQMHLNAPGCTGLGALPHSDDALRAEALAVLELAARGEAVPHERAERFARDYVESLAMGAAALAVIDGGRFAGARLVDLAVAVVAGGTQQQKTRSSG